MEIITLFMWFWIICVIRIIYFALTYKNNYMKDLGITKGEWIATLDGVYSNDENTKGNIVCESPSSYYESMTHWNKNAKLIADAGTTAKKCGLLPSELLEQRDEMLMFMKYLNHCGGLGQDKHERIEQLIKKATE